MAETRAHGRLKRMFPKAHWQRFESWSGIGVFDSNGCMEGQEIWVEFKEVKPPKFSLTDEWIVKPKVRKSQIAWQALKERSGGRTFIALLVGPTLFILPGGYLRALQNGIPLGYVKRWALDPETIFDRYVRSIGLGKTLRTV